ncbi:MAG: response regulator [Alphaproteobacteria bacterium]|nr:response regulator [Alphaproteobacteria bacterium]MBL7098053.1 response regulator [Alphaproteobacteria bacterium]
MRALLKALLHALGIAAIFEATDGAGAFDLLRRKEPDLILTDLSMSPVDGLAFVREVRHSPTSPNPYIPIIMVTGHTEKHRVEAARDAGVTEVLAKPIAAGSLIQRIAEIVNRPRAFVRGGEYFGPDRRRRQTPEFTGPFRRREDQEDIAIR